MKKHLFLLLLLSVFLPFLKATEMKKIDSLLNIYVSAEKKQKVEICIEIAREYKLNGVFSKAEKYINEALTLAEADDVRLNAVIHHELGKIYASNKKYPEALEEYLKANDLYRQSGDHPLATELYVKIASIYTLVDQLDNANKYIDKAETHYFEKKVNVDSLLLKIYMMHGVIFGYQQLLDSSLFYNKKAFDISVELNDKTRIGGLINNIAVILTKKNDYDGALKWYKRVVEMMDPQKDNYVVGLTKYNVGLLYLKMNEKSLAKKYFLESADLLLNVDNQYSLMKVYYNLSEIYEEEKDYKTALNYYTLYGDMYDSLINIEMYKQINDIENKYELEQKDEQISMLTKVNQAYKTQRYLYIGGIILLTISLIIGWRYVRMSLKNIRLKKQILRTENEKLEKELQYKSKELESFAMRIIQKNEMLERLNSEISKLKGKNVDDSSLSEISSMISQNLYIDKDRDQLENQLDIIQQAFLLRLNSKHPGLSKSEIRLCSLLILGLTSKDIASVMNISPDSVKKNRYRLRKKLELQTEDELESYLKTI